MSLVSVSCMINIEFYPFDTQECPVWFMLTGYFSTEAQLHAVNKEAPLKYHFDNGMWELIMSEARAEYGVLYGVNLKMKRTPYFVIVIDIIPIILLSLMSFMVFLLPPESGERMSYSITILLALIVFLTIISETIPKKSSPLPLLLYFVGLYMLQSVLVTLATILNLRLYYKDEKNPVPAWLCSCLRKRKTCHEISSESKMEQECVSNQAVEPTLANGRVRRTTESDFGIRHVGDNWQLHKAFNDEQQRIVTEEPAFTEVSWKVVSRIIDKILFTFAAVYFVVVFVVFVLITVSRN